MIQIKGLKEYVKSRINWQTQVRDENYHEKKRKKRKRIQSMIIGSIQV